MVYQIAIDGPAGSGKSTVAKRVSETLNITYLDTGAMYRAVTYAVLQAGLSVHKKEDLKYIVDNATLHMEPSRVCINNEDVTLAIRMPEITSNVSYVAMDAYVRERLVDLQQAIANSKSVIMDGRDIGTKVLPHARFKYFLVASTHERAKRRWLELTEKGINNSIEAIEEDLLRRDALDSEREASPLVQAEDAVLIDTTDKSIDEVCRMIINDVKGAYDDMVL